MTHPRLYIAICCALCLALLAGSSSPAAAPAPGEALHEVPLAAVDITDDFWAPRIEVNRSVSIQHCFRKFEQSRGFDNPRLIEAAAYMLAKQPDPALEKYVKGLIDREVAGVEVRISSPDRVIRVSGYFFEAAVAWYRATGQRKMLDAALKAIDAMDAAYGPGKRTYIPGHEGLDIGLVAMYRQTGDQRYLKLAQFFLDERGKDGYPRQGEYALDRTYAQDHKPVIQQTEAVGHCVRATYLYIPLTDIAAFTARGEYARAADAIWQDAVYRKTYVTGSIGSVRFHEQFGEPYELPNLSGWSETCASYGNFVWNQRMFLLHRDARYVDLMERVLYNGFLDGVSLKGDRFFYQNPLSSYGNYDRFDWIDTPCCPPNVVRLMASLGKYVYATDDSGIYVNLFVGCNARIDVAGHRVTLRQQTRYPWDGAVRIGVDPDTARTFPVFVRIPGWTGNQVMAGDLYRFLDSSRNPVILKVNGRTVNPAMANGYARIDRRWSVGDTIELNLPMPVRRVEADPRVKEDEGRVALERGPLVYAAEWADNGGQVHNLVVPDDAQLHSEFRKDLLNGVEVITGTVRSLSRNAAGTAVQERPHQLVAIPYFAWANRGMGEMAVWMPRRTEKARVSPILPPDPIARVRSSGGIEKKWTGYNDQNDDLAAVYDAVDPLSSADESHLYFRIRPGPGERAWVEYEFKRPAKVSSAEVYWLNDKRFCRLPASWRIVYKDGDYWLPVRAAGAYGIEKDRFNTVTFDPVTTTAVRLESEPKTVHYNAGEIGPPGALFLTTDIDWRELGIIEWRVR
ncbi:MAG: glycoside hydrolase family 127 protein [Acidobacteriia bacterium]|nr:glycoside hydrolase family 127 protein [Terriglobia bacterium]